MFRVLFGGLFGYMMYDEKYELLVWMDDVVSVHRKSRFLGLKARKHKTDTVETTENTRLKCGVLHDG